MLLLGSIFLFCRLYTHHTARGRIVRHTSLSSPHHHHHQASPHPFLSLFPRALPLPFRLLHAFFAQFAKEEKDNRSLFLLDHFTHTLAPFYISRPPPFWHPVASCLLLAGSFGLLPDRHSYVRDERFSNSPGAEARGRRGIRNEIESEGEQWKSLLYISLPPLLSF